MTIDIGLDFGENDKIWVKPAKADELWMCVKSEVVREVEESYD